MLVLVDGLGCEQHSRPFLLLGPESTVGLDNARTPALLLVLPRSPPTAIVSSARMIWTHAALYGIWNEVTSGVVVTSALGTSEK